jgi:hypothetical protein
MQFRPFLLLILAVPALAQKPKPAAPAIQAVPAAPAKPADSRAMLPAIISSEMSGRDLVFIANAMDLGRALTFLAGQAGQTSNANLKGFGEGLSKTLAAHAALLDTVAEMRKLKAPAESPTETRLKEKLALMQGQKLEKAILNAFIEVNERLVATYQLGMKSGDVTIVKFADQALPQAEEHLMQAQQMAGIAPKRRMVSEKPVARVAANEVSPVTPPAAKVAPEPISKEAAPIEPAPVVVRKEPEVKPKASLPTAKEAAPIEPAPVLATKKESEPKPKVSEPAPPEPIAEAPAEEVVPKKLEGESSKPPKRPTFRTNVKPLSE